MYILRLKINRRAQAFVNARKSITEMHSRVCRLFPSIEDGVDLKSHTKYGMLWRLDWDRRNPGAQEYLTVSATRTQPTAYYYYPEADVELKELDDNWPHLDRGGLYMFRLVGNPVRTVKNERGRGKRVGLRHPDELRHWLERRLTTVPGDPQTRQWASLEELRFWGPAYQPQSYWHTGVKGDGSKVGVNLVQFDGTIRVTDPMAASRIVREGVATGAKSYGAGLLSLRKHDFASAVDV